MKHGLLAVLLVLVGAGTLVGQSRTPVLLVPGWFDTERDLAALRIRLVSAGWPGGHVEALTFRNPTGSNVEHGEEIRAAVEALRDRTGAERIDIVAHSMGGLGTRSYLAGYGGGSVRRVVFVATPHRGTYTAYVAFGEGRDEMIPGSTFLDSLNAKPPVPVGVESMTIRTPFDARILPGESATLSGVEDHQVCCPSHAGLLRHIEVFRLIYRFLTDGPSDSGPEPPQPAEVAKSTRSARSRSFSVIPPALWVLIRRVTRS